MTGRGFSRNEVTATRYRSAFLSVPMERAIAGHRELMAERARRPVVVWCGAMRDLSPVTGEDARYCAPEPR